MNYAKPYRPPGEPLGKGQSHKMMASLRAIVCRVFKMSEYHFTANRQHKYSEGRSIFSTIAYCEHIRRDLICLFLKRERTTLLATLNRHCKFMELQDPISKEYQRKFYLCLNEFNAVKDGLKQYTYGD